MKTGYHSLISFIIRFFLYLISYFSSPQFSTDFLLSKKRKNSDSEEKNIRKRGFAFAKIPILRFNKQHQNVWRMRSVANRRRDAFAFTTADCNPGNRPRSTRPRIIPNIMTVRYTPARRRDAFRSRTTPSAHLSIWTGPRTFLIVASARMWRIVNDIPTDSPIPFLCTFVLWKRSPRDINIDQFCRESLEFFLFRKKNFFFAKVKVLLFLRLSYGKMKREI